MALLQHLESPPGTEEWMFFCPGCGYHHKIRTGGPGKDVDGVPVWSWDGHPERPSFSPSLVTQPDGPYRCHLWILEGELMYLPDCWHSQAKRTIPMIDLEEV